MLTHTHIGVHLVGMVKVAAGMQALAAAKLIHRDLASRNALVFVWSVDDPTAVLVKVADFGLTEKAYTATYKVVEGGPKPCRWLAPEAVRQGKHSEKSDVWAFGVLIREVPTDAATPYFQKSDDDDVIAYVTGGGRLPRPDECPDALWDLMRACWAANRKDRPTFAQVVATLGMGSATGIVAASAAHGEHLPAGVDSGFLGMA